MRRLLLSAAALVLIASSTAWGADTSPPPAAKADPLGGARAQIAQKNWPGAIAELKRVNDSGNADWNSLMGYSLRRSATPDYAAAAGFYDAALRLNPQHRGALEYSGELFLITNDLPKAESQLAVLDKACSMSCEEAVLLKKAIDRYKANGNKYVPAPW